MKKIIFIILSIFIWVSFTFSLNASSNINFWNASKATNEIKKVSIANKTWNIQNQITNTTYNVFMTLKIIIWWLLVIYLVYAWTMMIMSMWDDENSLSESKRSIWYAIVGLLFINIPWTLYNSFSNKRTTDDVTSNFWDSLTIYQRNIFMNSDIFWSTLWNLITFLQIFIVAVAIFMIVYAWIQMIIASWEEDKIKSAKDKILWSIAWLLFIWIMEVWRNVVFKWDFKWQWQELFATLANLALFFAWPIAIFFLSLAWYYYITSWWDEEKVKKAKNIVLNTLIAVLILIWTYTLLIDLKTLSF